MARAEPLTADNFLLPKSVRDIVVKARVQWLRNTEVQDLLHNHMKYGLKVRQGAPPSVPRGGLATREGGHARGRPAGGHARAHPGGGWVT